MATINGNSSPNNLVGTSVRDVIRGFGRNDMLSGLAGNDLLDGGTGDDLLLGGLGNDVLLGGAGNDRLDGGAGNDRMTGGTGSDIYIVDSTGDRAIEGLRGGTDIVFSAVTFTLGANVENLTLTGFGLHGTGNALGNVITGNGAKNVLRGLGGDDVMFGGDGGDTLVGGAGNDIYIATCNCDTFVELAGGGTDLVRSSVDFDLRPMPHNHVATPHIENLTLFGAGAINGSGNAANNVIVGNGSINRLRGFEGDDTLNGGAGADILVGGAGRDRLTGGAGADIFRYESAADSPASAPSPAAADTILDFSQIDLDRIDLSAIDADTTSASDNFTFVETNTFSGAAGELRYEAHTIGSIQFTLVEADLDGDQDADMQVLVRGNLTLTAADFVL